MYSLQQPDIELTALTVLLAANNDKKKYFPLFILWNWKFIYKLPVYLLCICIYIYVCIYRYVYIYKHKFIYMSDLNITDIAFMAIFRFLIHKMWNMVAIQRKSSHTCYILNEG